MADQFQPANTTDTRGHWSTRYGFILAAAGSAVGLGNIWKFPYIAGVYGGGAFVLVYLGCVALVGLPLMISELIIGRRTQENPVGAFQKLHRKGSPWQGAGWLGVAAAFTILAFYSVVSGRVLSYIVRAFSGFEGTAEQISAQYSAFVADPYSSALWHSVFMLLTIVIVLGGIKRGIERCTRVLMPALLVLLTGLVFYGLFATDGGSRAISFLFEPDFSKLSAEGVLSALGHACFTLSVGMGAMITYGSYMRRDTSIVRDAVTISILDTVIALLAGIAIFSLVFAYGVEPNAGPGLIFETLPVLFVETGAVIAIPFFVLLAFAALSSTISLLEVVVSYLIDERGWRRTPATLAMGGVIWGLGILCAVDSLKVPFRGSDQSFFDIFDFVASNYMLPFGGLFICIFVAWVIKANIRMEEFGSHGTLYHVTMFILRFITPLAVLAVLLHGLELLPFMDY